MDIATIQSWAIEAGFAKAALCEAKTFEEQRRYVEGQKPLTERRQLRYNPQEDMPQIKSLIVLLWSYDFVMPKDDDYVYIDPYYSASNAAYHAAKKLEQRLTQAGCFAKANVPYPAKTAAVRAGLGIIGKNSLLITPEYGTRVVIILIACDLEVETAANIPLGGTCLQCGNCSAACPSGALDEQGMTYPHRCMRNYMMEGIIVPECLRERMENRLIGCDACQRVCPMQPAGAAENADMSFRLDDFVIRDEACFSRNLARLADQIGRNTARPQRVRAQAALLAGNSGNSAYLPVLSLWTESPFETVREHARWAIERIERAQK